MSQAQESVRAGTAEDRKGAAVRFPPPLVFAIGLLSGWGLQAGLPLGFERPLSQLLGWVAILSGAMLILLAQLALHRAGTSIEPWKPTTTIVTRGIYAWSRNPIYVAMALVSAGIGLVLNNAWMALSSLPALFIVYWIAVRKEERYLEEKFGTGYSEYRQKVRRWL